MKKFHMGKNTRLLGGVAAFFIFLNLPLWAQTAASDISPKAVLDVMQRVADWQLTHPSQHKSTDWTQGAGDAGIMALAGISGDAKYRDAMLAMGATNEWKLGPKLYDADDHCIGQTYAELYFLCRAPKMIAPLREKFDAILAKPTEVQNYEYAKPFGKARENWSWCDSLFMAPPAWVRLYAATGDEKYLNFAVKNWWRTTDYLYDKDEHLYFRDSTYFKKTEANGKKVFWGRGNGWVMAGLVRVLQYLPMNHPDRPRFEQLFKDMSAKILTCQQVDGLWRASLLDPDSYPLKETSGSGFYTYALAWGVNQGLLEKEKYKPAVRKAWAALTDCVAADGKLTHVQPIGADPKKFAEDSTEVYGVGAFLLAGSEVYRLALLSNLAKNSFLLPTVVLSEIPITTAIINLGRVAGIDISFDSKLFYSKDGKKLQEPEVNVKLRDILPENVIKILLEQNHLQLTQNPASKNYLITQIDSNNPAVNLPYRALTPVVLKIANPSDFYRSCETVAINWRDINNSLNDDVQFAILDGVSARIIDSQTYSSNGGKATDRLLFQVDLAPKESRIIYLFRAQSLPAIPPPIVKTFARYVPERFDDFAWESDRIAHRTYGQALIKAEHTISSGPDVWIKKNRELTVDVMYATKHYHEDNGEFMDDYRVGKSRGDGGIGIWDGKKLFVSSNYRNWKLITTGPIRSEFELTYDAWDVGNGRMVSETKRYSIDAGSWMTKAQSTFASDDQSPLTIGVGLAERACPTNREEFIAHDQSEGWLTYWQPDDVPKATTATAIVLPKDSVSEFTNDNPAMPDSAKHANVPQPTHEGYPAIRNQLAISQAEVGKPFEYYFGASWDRSGDFTNHIQWENYVKRFAERRDQPLQVSVGN